MGGLGRGNPSNVGAKIKSRLSMDGLPWQQVQSRRAVENVQGQISRTLLNQNGTFIVCCWLPNLKEL